MNGAKGRPIDRVWATPEGGSPLVTRFYLGLPSARTPRNTSVFWTPEARTPRNTFVFWTPEYFCMTIRQQILNSLHSELKIWCRIVMSYPSGVQNTGRIVMSYPSGVQNTGRIVRSHPSVVQNTNVSRGLHPSGVQKTRSFFAALVGRQGRGVSNTPTRRHQRWRIHVLRSSPAGPIVGRMRYAPTPGT